MAVSCENTFCFSLYSRVLIFSISSVFVFSLNILEPLFFKFNKRIAKHVGCSGEEYEMLVAFDKRYKKALLRRSKQSRTPLNIFAIATRKKYANRCKSHHF